MKKKFFLFLLVIVPWQLFAAQDFYQFDSESQRMQFSALTGELRCLVCQNQNLAESNAPLAMDLRDQVYLYVKQGRSNQQIIDYLVARYGNFILYRPPLNIATLGLWFGPLVFLLVGLGWLGFYLKKK